ncbi:hypothetical protein PIB30_103117, partial [Stylosanthes scabra]|nr:hypothetical protein [Stylosanthes scabra]
MVSLKGGEQGHHEWVGSFDLGSSSIWKWLHIPALFPLFEVSHGIQVFNQQQLTLLGVANDICENI